MRKGNFQSGLHWWDYIQSFPKEKRAKIINNSAKPMLDNCIKKYDNTV
jgi:hypothetical protein